MELQTDRQTGVLQGASPRVADQCVAVLCKQVAGRKSSVSAQSGPRFPPVPSSMSLSVPAPRHGKK